MDISWLSEIKGYLGMKNNEKKPVKLSVLSK